MNTATFGAGCFWGVEAAFCKIKGVKSTAVGYMGGTKEKPTYEQVCSDTTGHAEVVQVMFDPDVISYDDLLAVFWDIHDPTTSNRQGLDMGSQYRSVIFFHNSQQEKAAWALKNKLQKSTLYNKNIVTDIVPVSTFWKAEDYHQRYFEKQGQVRCAV